MIRPGEVWEVAGASLVLKIALEGVPWDQRDQQSKIRYCDQGAQKECKQLGICATPPRPNKGQIQFGGYQFCDLWGSPETAKPPAR